MGDRQSGRRAGPRQIGDTFRAQRIDPHRPRDVLNGLLAEILERVSQLVTDLLVHRPGDADPAGLGESFQACGDIDAIAKDVVTIGDHVAKIDADAQPDPLFVWQSRLAVEHPALHLGGAAYRVDDARKFREQTVAGRLDDPAPVLGDLRIDQLPAVRLEAFERALLVGAHQARIARHIGGEDRGKTAGRGHGCGSPPLSQLLVIKEYTYNARCDTRVRATRVELWNHLPLNTGRRFSAKARLASRWSSVIAVRAWCTASISSTAASGSVSAANRLRFM